MTNNRTANKATTEYNRLQSRKEVSAEIQRGDKSSIAWGITGAGHFLTATVSQIEALKQVELFLSKAAEEVLVFYRLMERLQRTNHVLHVDVNSCASAVTKLYMGKYDLVVVAPVTSNTIAKMVQGIADNLVTNLFAHAGKCRIPTIILPCDSLLEMKSLTPKGEEVSVYVRDIDRENIERISQWEGVSVVNNPQELQCKITELTSQGKGY